METRGLSYAPWYLQLLRYDSRVFRHVVSSHYHVGGHERSSSGRECPREFFHRYVPMVSGAKAQVGSYVNGLSHPIRSSTISHDGYVRYGSRVQLHLVSGSASGLHHFRPYLSRRTKGGYAGGGRLLHARHVFSMFFCCVPICLRVVYGVETGHVQYRHSIARPSGGGLWFFSVFAKGFVGGRFPSTVASPFLRCPTVSFRLRYRVQEFRYRVGTYQFSRSLHSVLHLSRRANRPSLVLLIVLFLRGGSLRFCVIEYGAFLLLGYGVHARAMVFRRDLPFLHIGRQDS